MKSNEKDPKNQAGNANSGKSESNTSKDRISQWHKLDAPSAAPPSNSAPIGKEPILRSSTTDSSRVPKNSIDDMPTGGNIR